MEKTYKIYQQIEKEVHKPSYSKFNKKLQELFATKTPILKSDIQELIHFLSNEDPKKQYFALDFLFSYPKAIPNELYHSIFNAGIRSRDPDNELFFFSLAKRIKGEEYFFNTLLDKIKNGSNEEKILTIHSFYWTFSFYNDYLDDNEVTYQQKIELKHSTQLQKKLYSVIELLLDEFLNNKNLIVRHVCFKALPNNVKKYPFSLRKKGIKVINLAAKIGLPKEERRENLGFFYIWNQAIKEEKLGELFFDQLKWRSRTANPDEEWKAYQAFKAEMIKKK